MKKIIITMMAIAFSLSAWSANYEVCSSLSMAKLERCVTKLANEGYEPSGSLLVYVVAGNAFQYTQPMFKK